MSTSSLTPEELDIQISKLEKELADLEKKPEPLPSESNKFRERLLNELDKYGIKLPVKDSILSDIGEAGAQIVAEAGGAAVGQKAGMLAGAPLAPFTAGLSVPIGAAIGGFAGGMGGYEAATRGRGEIPTVRGRLQAGLMGAIPFAPEARMLAGVGGQLAKATGREMLESAGIQGLASAGAVIAPAAYTGELDKLSPTEVALVGAGGAAGGAAARYGGAATTGSSVVGRKYAGEELAVGPSKKAASSLIAKRQQLGRDQDMANWELLGGINDARIVNPTGVTKAVSAVAGESDEVTRVIRDVNTRKAGEVARREVGIPADAEFSLDVMKARAQELKNVYGDVKAVSPAAKAKVDDVEDARDVMRRTWKIWKEAKDSNKGTTPVLLERAKKATAQHEKLENQLDAIVTKAGRPDLSQRLLEVRPQLAKLNVLEQAIEPGLRTMDVSVLGKLVKDAPGLVTDDLALLGRIYNIQENAFEATKAIQGAGTNRSASRTMLLPAGATLGGSAGYYLGSQSGLGGLGGGIIGAVAGAGIGQSARDLASSALTGGQGGIPAFLQRGLSTPQYQTNVPSALSLFLAKSGVPISTQAQSFIDRSLQEKQSLPPSR